jgi:LysM repeat protein
VDPSTRRELTRYGAPAAFLVAVTIAVLLVKAGLSGGDGSTTTVAASATTRPTTTGRTTTRLVLTTPTGTTTTATTAQEGEYYVIETGDTLGTIAEKYDTTVEELVRLNPGVDPTALRVGDRIRVS